MRTLRIPSRHELFSRGRAPLLHSVYEVQLRLDRSWPAKKPRYYGRSSPYGPVAGLHHAFRLETRDSAASNKELPRVRIRCSPPAGLHVGSSSRLCSEKGPAMGPFFRRTTTGERAKRPRTRQFAQLSLGRDGRVVVCETRRSDVDG